MYDLKKCTINILGILQGIMHMINQNRLVIIRLDAEKGGIKIKKQAMDSSDFNGIYEEMVQILGIETVKKINKYYKGQQITFPIRLYSKKYVLKRLSEYNGKNLKALSRELEYSERWLRHLIDTECK